MNIIMNFLKKQIVLTFLIVLLIIGQIITNGILLSSFNMFGMSIMIAVMGLLVLGENLVIITRGIDLSIGAIASFTTVICAAMMNRLSGKMDDIFVIIITSLVVIVLGMAFGTLAGLSISKFSVPPFVATLCTMSIAYGFAWFTLGGRPTAIKIDSFKQVAWGSVVFVPIPVIIILVVTTIFHIIMKLTKTGTYFFAVGGNEYALRLSGINSTVVKISAYTISGSLAALSGILIAAMTASGSVIAARGYEFLAITGVVLGGTSLFGGEGRIANCVIAAIIIVILKNILSLVGISPYIQEAIIGTMLIAIAYVDIRSRE